MPFELRLPKKIKQLGWKVKIREKERVEPPHVTVMHKAQVWRIDLRNRLPLVPPGGSIKEIDPEVWSLICANWTELLVAWDRMYPENPVSSEGKTNHE